MSHPIDIRCKDDFFLLSVSNEPFYSSPPSLLPLKYTCTYTRRDETMKGSWTKQSRQWVKVPALPFHSHLQLTAPFVQNHLTSFLYLFISSIHGEQILLELPPNQIHLPHNRKCAAACLSFIRRILGLSGYYHRSSHCRSILLSSIPFKNRMPFDRGQKLLLEGHTRPSFSLPVRACEYVYI